MAKVNSERKSSDGGKHAVEDSTGDTVNVEYFWIMLNEVGLCCQWSMTFFLFDASLNDHLVTDKFDNLD